MPTATKKNSQSTKNIKRVCTLTNHSTGKRNDFRRRDKHVELYKVLSDSSPRRWSRSCGRGYGYAPVFGYAGGYGGGWGGCGGGYGYAPVGIFGYAGGWGGGCGGYGYAPIYGAAYGGCGGYGGGYGYAGYGGG